MIDLWRDYVGSLLEAARAQWSSADASQGKIGDTTLLPVLKRHNLRLITRCVISLDRIDR